MLSCTLLNYLGLTIMALVYMVTGINSWCCWDGPLQQVTYITLTRAVF